MEDGCWTGQQCALEVEIRTFNTDDNRPATTKLRVFTLVDNTEIHGTQFSA